MQIYVIIIEKPLDSDMNEMLCYLYGAKSHSVPDCMEE